MDWSSVFEDEGEESGDWERSEISSRTGMLSWLKEGYTPIICYAFTVNYILGVGCLGVPFAFLQSGIVLGSCLIILLSFVSYVTVLWVASAALQEIKINLYQMTKSSNPFVVSPHVSRIKNRRLSKLKYNNKNTINNTTNNNNNKPSERSRLLPTTIVDNGDHVNISSSITWGSLDTATANNNKNNNNNHNNNNLIHSYNSSIELLESNPKQSIKRSTSGAVTISNHPLQLTSSSSVAAAASSTASTDEHSLLGEELEVTDLIDEFLGPYGSLVYQASLMMLTYVGLLAYTQVFNDTFVQQLHPSSIASLPSYLPAILFGLIVIPLSCFDLNEQIVAQVVMSILRFLSLGILFFGTCLALYLDYDHSALQTIYSTHAAQLQHQQQHQTVPLVQFSGFGVMFTTAIFSQLFQHSVPGLIRPLKEEDKKYIPIIFRNALLTTALLYIGTGIVSVLYFGPHLKQSINLNFIDFTWGADIASFSLFLFCLVKLLAMIVVLFPALDTLSVFPLIAITLGNNLNAAFPGMHHLVYDLLVKYRTTASTAPTVASVSATNRHDPLALEAKKISIVLWRLIAAIPPVICSLLVKNLVISLQIAGLCGIIVALVAPALLHTQAQQRSNLLPPTMMVHLTLPFPKFFNHLGMVYLVLTIASIALVICLLQMAQML